MNPNKGEQVQSVDLWRMGEGMIAASWHLVYRASHCGQYTSVVSGWACCPVTNYFSRVSSVVCSISMQRIEMGCMSLLIYISFLAGVAHAIDQYPIRPPD